MTVLSQIWPYSDYDGKKKKSKGSKLFIVPDEKQAFFAKCTADAKKKLDGNWYSVLFSHQLVCHKKISLKRDTEAC